MAVLFGEKAPVPDEDHVAPVAMVNEPLRETTALFAQTVWSAPAFAVGAGVIVIVNWSVTGRHPPLFAVARVSVTLPAALSAALEVYDALSVFASGEKVPVPEDVHVPAPVEEIPLSVITELFAQTVLSLPAFTVGGGVKKTVILSSSELQVPLFAEVKIKIVLPPEISPALGTYVAFNVFIFGENDPPPSVVHVPLPVEEYPFKCAFGLFMQTEIFVPAFTSGAFEIVTTIVFVTTVQSPLPVVVRIIFTLPAAVSTALGV
jgi:hypothetical protein